MAASASYMLGPMLGALLFTSFRNSLKGSVALVLVCVALTHGSLVGADPNSITAGHEHNAPDDNNGGDEDADADAAGVSRSKNRSNRDRPDNMASTDPPPLPMSISIALSALPSGARLLLCLRLLMSFGACCITPHRCTAPAMRIE
jgi:hypothetical protein